MHLYRKKKKWILYIIFFIICVYFLNFDKLNIRIIMIVTSQKSIYNIPNIILV